MRRIPRLRRAPGLATPSSAYLTSNIPRSCASIFTRHSNPSRRNRNFYTHGVRCNIWGASTPLVSRRAYSSASDVYKQVQTTQQEAEVEGQSEEQWEESEGSVADLPAELKTDLAVPGPIEVAPRPDEVQEQSYVPAESGAELEEIGGLTGYWEDDSKWNPALEIRVFGPGTTGRITDPAVLEVMARRAVVEAIAVRDRGAGADSKSGLTDLWAQGGAEDRSRALGVQIDVANDGVVSLKGDVDGVVSGLARDPRREEAEADVPIDAEEARELLKSWDSSWKRIPLEDAALKFAITKRILQLTGQTIRDAKLPSIHNVQGLLAVLVKPPKPKKVTDDIRARGNLLKMPNVKVYDRRITPIDKEQSVGRWKVIVKELENRDLPITGTGKYGPQVENKWVDPRLTSRASGSKSARKR